MTPMSNIVEAINCIFRLNYIFYTWLTLKMWVARVETIMQITMPKAISMSGYMKLEMK